MSSLKQYFKCPKCGAYDLLYYVEEYCNDMGMSWIIYYDVKLDEIVEDGESTDCDPSLSNDEVIFHLSEISCESCDFKKQTVYDFNFEVKEKGDFHISDFEEKYLPELYKKFCVS